MRSAVPRFRYNVRCDTFFFELRLRCFEQRKNLRSQVIRSQISCGITQKLVASNRETPCQRRRTTAPRHTRTLPRTA